MARRSSVSSGASAMAQISVRPRSRSAELWRGPVRHRGWPTQRLSLSGSPAPTPRALPGAGVFSSGIGRPTCPVRCCSGSWPTGSRPMRPAISIRPPSSGGKAFSRGHLYKILTNPIYIGQLSHRGRTYDGQHPAIVEQATWDNAQAQLASHAHRRACRQLASAHLLMGRIQDDRGHAMTQTHAQKGSRRYRYYVSQAVLQGKPEPGSTARVSAPEIEGLVIGAMRSARPKSSELSDGDLILNHLHRVTLHEGRVEIAINGEDEAPINLPWSKESPQRRREILLSQTCVR